MGLRRHSPHPSVAAIAVVVVDPSRRPSFLHPSDTTPSSLVDFTSPQFTLYHRHRINYFLCAHPHPITELVGSWLDGCSENYHPRRRCVVCPPNDYVVTVMSLAEVVDEEEEEAGDYGDGVGRRHRYTEHQGEKK